MKCPIIFLKYTEMVCQAKRDLRNGHVPLEELVVTQSLSRAVEGYSSPSPAARAAMQLQATGKEVAPGQFMRFVFVRGEERVRVWELGVDARTVDIKRYCAMLDRAVDGLVGVFEKRRLGWGYKMQSSGRGGRPKRLQIHCNKPFVSWQMPCEIKECCRWLLVNFIDRFL